MNTIGKYKIIKELGSGGFGAVYLCEDTIGNQVAIKFFQPKDDAIAGMVTSATSDAGEVLKQRFQEEAKILHALSENPYIVNFMDYDETESGIPYYVMPYIPRCLTDEIGKDAFSAGAREEIDPELYPRKLPLDRAIIVLEQTANALSAVHKTKLVHRDIKPANLLINKKGDIQLCDFGIAKLPDAEHSQTGVGMGSRNYMSPEQRESAKHVEPSSDIYSLGVIAYRLVTGTLPIGHFDEPIELRPSIGKALNKYILLCLRFEAKQRPQDAQVFLQGLKAAVNSIDQHTPDVDDNTGTLVGGVVPVIKDELKPLKAEILSLLNAHGQIQGNDLERLKVAAEFNELDVSGLNTLIDYTKQENRTLLTPKLKLVEMVKKKVKEKGYLTQVEYDVLLVQIKSTNWQAIKLKELIQEAGGRVEDSSPEPEPTTQTPAKNKSSRGNTVNVTRQQTKPKIAQLKKPSSIKIIAAFVWLALIFGGYWLIQHPEVYDLNLEMEFVNIPSGSYQMGSNNGTGYAEPVHTVNVQSFSMMKYEVTRGLWKTVMGSNPSGFDDCGSNCPVDNMSWDDIQAFIQKLNKKTGKQYRLPSEAEWEYAARAGTTTKYSWGNFISHANANYGTDECCEGRAEGKDQWVRASPVGSFSPNKFGLYDMHGNVSEWVQDCWNESYKGAPSTGSLWTQGDCTKHISRGGSWLADPIFLLSASRSGDLEYAGFRLVSPSQKVEPSSNQSSQFKKHELWVDTAPINAKVRILNIVPTYQWGMLLKPGEYHIEVSARGYETKKQWVTMVNQEITTKINLNKVSKAKKFVKKNLQGMVFVKIPSGSFHMGSNEDTDEQPIHRVTISVFKMMANELTWAQYQPCIDAGVCSSDGGLGWGKANRPVINVSWDDIQTYIQWLNKKTGQHYRLPSEAEWEYAARAGTTTKYSWGNDINCSQARFDHYEGGCGDERKTLPVGSFKANAFGLYDMHGNVQEWVQDCWYKNYKGAPSNSKAWERGECAKRVARGGSWNYEPNFLRSAVRVRGSASTRYNDLGFRLVQGR